MAEFSQSPQDTSLRDHVVQMVELAEPQHQAFRRKADHAYELWRNVQSWRSAYRDSNSPRGRDDIMRDGQNHFGQELFIPIVFSVIETMVPRMLASRPEMQVFARDPESEANAENVRRVIGAQQEQINYELKLQTIAKDGLMYGLGVQKVQWCTEHKRRQQLMLAPDGTYVPTPVYEKVFDDPNAWSIDPRDFIFDPFATDIDDCEWAVHRTWRSNRYLSKMAQLGAWRNLDDVADLNGLTDASKWAEVFNRKIAAEGMPTGTGLQGQAQRLHEVLEFHDGEQVITVVDRKLVVQQGPNPNWHGELPFQTFRPTEDPHRMYGVGEIEPIEGLQQEMNELRNQRRYNARLVLQRVFAYADGMVDEDDLVIGPGAAIRTTGDPRDVLFQIPIADIPNSGYQEEDRISADIDRVSGISDALAGGADPSQTATGAQLGATAASARISNKVLRMELEIIDPGAGQFVSLDQQYITDSRQVPVQQAQEPADIGQMDRSQAAWKWLQVGPEQLSGQFLITTPRGSTQMPNVPQDRADAQNLQLLVGNPLVDQARLTTLILEKLGVDNPPSYLAPPDPKVPPEALDAIKEHLVTDLKVDPALAQDIIARSLAEAGGPDMSGGAPLPGEGANPMEGAPTPAPPTPAPAPSGGSNG